MTSALRKPLSLAQFLAWEEAQERPWEFDGAEPVAMTGGTYAHDLITYSLRQALRMRLAGTNCRPCGPNLKILVAGHVRYPDAFVTCSPVSPNATIVDNPVVVFEVASDDARTDRIDKLREYQATPSIQRYVILEQKSIGATVFERRGEIWPATALRAGDTLDMPEIGIALPLDECYLDVEFGQPP